MAEPHAPSKKISTKEDLITPVTHASASIGDRIGMVRIHPKDVHIRLRQRHAGLSIPETPLPATIPAEGKKLAKRTLPPADEQNPHRRKRHPALAGALGSNDGTTAAKSPRTRRPHKREGDAALAGRGGTPGHPLLNRCHAGGVFKKKPQTCAPQDQ